MINVLHIVLGLQIGGLERVVVDLINNCSPEIRSYVVCLEEAGALALSCHAAKVYELHKHPGLSIATVRQLDSLARELKIDLIHTHNPSPHFYGALAGLLAGIPVVHTKHGRNYPDNIRKVVLNRVAGRLTRKIVAVSGDAAAICIGVEKNPPDKVMVIVNGIDTGLYSPAADGKSQPGNSVCIIGIVARLSPEKDHHTLLAACKLLRDRQFHFQLVIIGDGPLRSELEQDAGDLGITGQVEFVGMSNDVARQLQRLDVFVLCSTTEGISLTLLEAMATRLPVVASDVGGNPEVVVDGTTGFIVPAKNPELLADRLCMLINDQCLRETMGLAGRKRVEEQFDIRQTVRNYERLYHDVLGIVR